MEEVGGGEDHADVYFASCELGKKKDMDTTPTAILPERGNEASIY